MPGRGPPCVTAFPCTRVHMLLFQVPSAAGLCGPAYRTLEGPASALSALPPLSAPLTVALAAIMHPCRDDGHPSTLSDLSDELLLRGVPPRSQLARLQQMQRSSSSRLSTPLACLVASGCCCSPHQAVSTT